MRNTATENLPPIRTIRLSRKLIESVDRAPAKPMEHDYLDIYIVRAAENLISRPLNGQKRQMHREFHQRNATNANDKNSLRDMRKNPFSSH